MLALVPLTRGKFPLHSDQFLTQLRGLAPRLVTVGTDNMQVLQRPLTTRAADGGSLWPFLLGLTITR